MSTSQREKSGRKPGGQPGHEGHTLTFREKPNRVVLHAPERCSGCGTDLTNPNLVLRAVVGQKRKQKVGVTEAGPPPDDWVAYQIIKDKLNINLKIVLLPATQADQDTKINTAAASNSLPDLFFVNRDTWFNVTEAGLTVDKLDVSDEVDSDASLAFPVLTAYIESHPDLRSASAGFSS